MAEIDKLLEYSEPVFNTVHPILAQRTKAAIVALYGLGFNFGALCGLRTMQQQAALYAQGRTIPGKIVTKAGPGDSEHNYGIAIDLAEDGNIAGEKVEWSWAKAKDYLVIGKVTTQCGLEWGGLWKSITDNPHVQITGGLTLPSMKAIYLSHGLEGVWDRVTELLA